MIFTTADQIALAGVTVSLLMSCLSLWQNAKQSKKSRRLEYAQRVGNLLAIYFNGVIQARRHLQKMEEMLESYVPVDETDPAIMLLSLARKECADAEQMEAGLNHNSEFMDYVRSGKTPTDLEFADLEKSIRISEAALARRIADLSSFESQLAAVIEELTADTSGARP